MIQENKQVLLKDLSARLPYGVICKVEFKDSEGWKTQNMSLKGLFIDECYFSTDKGSTYSKEFKPYLRPMSSMTEGEREKFNIYGGVMSYNPQNDTWAISAFTPEAYDWLNANHFDYRGLIPKSLAIEVTKENNPYEDINL